MDEARAFLAKVFDHRLYALWVIVLKNVYGYVTLGNQRAALDLFNDQLPDNEKDRT